jgi:hypothetical protein
MIGYSDVDEKRVMSYISDWGNYGIVFILEA